MNPDADEPEDDFLRDLRPAALPPDLLRRLRHAEPTLNAEKAWWQRALVAGGATAVAISLWVALDLAPDSQTTRQLSKTIPKMDLHAGEDGPTFAGNVALNIRLGASPDLIPVSLRPDYDPRARSRSERLGEVNLKVDLSNLNTQTTN